MSLVIVLDPLAGDLCVESEVLRRHGLTVEVLEADPGRRRAQLEHGVALLATDAPIDSRLLESMPRCRVAATYGVGYDNIDVAAARARGIAVTNVPDYCTDEVADHTMALLLGVSRRLVIGDRLVRRGEWGVEHLGPLRRLRGRVLGLVGYGRIGRAVGARARVFGLRVVAHDPVLASGVATGEPVEILPSLVELLEIADIVSLHLPLTGATHGLIDRAAVARMRPGAILLNTARGGLVDLPALVEALDQGRLSGAGLDVFPQEPPDPAVLGDRDRLVLSPHVAFYSVEAREQARRSAAEAIVAVLEGRPVANRVDPDPVVTRC